MQFKQYVAAIVTGHTIGEVIKIAAEYLIAAYTGG